MATTLAIAVSMASGLKSNFGTPIKPLHVGQAAYNGVLAAQLAEKGLTANHNAFDHEYGFFRVLNGADTYAPERVLADWDGPMEVLAPGIAIKQHPCCGSAHSAIDAALAIRGEHGPLRAADIASIETWTHQRRLAHTNRPQPRTGLDAKFSVQFLTGKALTSGIIRLSDFEDADFLDADALQLLPRTKSHPHDENNEYLGRVKVTLTDGRKLEGSASTEFGRGPRNPMSDKELEDKFIDCARDRMDGARASSLFRSILDLRNAPNVNAIMRATL